MRDEEALDEFVVVLAAERAGLSYRLGRRARCRGCQFQRLSNGEVITEAAGRQGRGGPKEEGGEVKMVG